MMLPQDDVVSVSDLKVWFPVKDGLFSPTRRFVRALDGVSFGIGKGNVLSLVGESGSGKTTAGRAILRLLPVTSGSISVLGKDITGLSRRALRPIRQQMQLIFQDPYASLNARMSVERILSTPLLIHRPQMPRAQRRDAIAETLRLVGLSPLVMERFPHEFSGGQRQRIGIARALMLRPSVLIADEPVSALDVSVQAQIVNLLLDLRESLGLTILFITHDLGIVGHISDSVAVMYLGRIVESGPVEEIFARPRHPYTEALFSAAPVADPSGRRERVVLKGEIPSPIDPPSGCAFRTRCRYAIGDCANFVPPLESVGNGHLKACIRELDLRPAFAA